MSKIILELDPGIDGALALAYALANDATSPVAAIVTSYGEIQEKQAYDNTNHLLDLLQRTDIPVFHGAQHPLDLMSYTMDQQVSSHHGQNGLGDINLPADFNPTPPPISLNDFINQTCLTEDLIYICTSPLTTLACLLAENPQLPESLSRVIVRAGVFTIAGDASSLAEGNIMADPAAAQQILTANFNLTLVPLDATAQTSLTAQQINNWQTNSVGKQLAAMAEFYFQSYTQKELNCPLADPLAVGIALQPDLVTVSLREVVFVGLDEANYGRNFIIPALQAAQANSIEIVLQTNAHWFGQLFQARMATFLKHLAQPEAPTAAQFQTALS
ncbi:nucleoside hydrolase [Lactobacillus sp. DCY120]|uniref:Nucleoside hydrolase n=1 Tax=Bombilactobacillus apium TaxID=2675299 RepID=A0A850QWA1_9LACO|nr:nucleoside hydrolase [Bombilactobacillus apium]NVY96074.1 nucleoside hydrolase [Bombilactobacillus apium]